jgi:DNA polymerase III sliding clamp (beta) subunit (PCNA family)
MGFSARYILELLNSMPLSSEIIVRLSGDVGPGLFQGTEDELYSCIVMPMRFE